MTLLISFFSPPPSCSPVSACYAPVTSPRHGPLRVGMGWWGECIYSLSASSAWKYYWSIRSQVLCKTQLLWSSHKARSLKRFSLATPLTWRRLSQSGNSSRLVVIDSGQIIRLEQPISRRVSETSLHNQQSVGSSQAWSRATSRPWRLQAFVNAPGTDPSCRQVATAASQAWRAGH